ncbi:MAG: cytidylate kinase family protein [Acidobacteriota bacterium]
MPIITISRGSASGGILLAKGLAEKTGYRLVSREDIIQSASKYGVASDTLEEALLKPPGFWERFRHERRRYLSFVQAALCDQAKEDGIIYHGNAGYILLRGISHVLCVHVVAPLPYRIEMLMKRENMLREDAVRYIEKMDQYRRDWTRFLYGVDWLDPNLYDLMINLKTLDIRGAVDIVAAAASRAEFQSTDESRKYMEDLLLASRVRSALAANHKTASVEIDVEARAGIIYLKGKIRPTSLIDAVVETVGKVKGVNEINQEGLGIPNYNV